MSQLKLGKGIKYTVIGASVINIFLQLMNFVMLFYTIVIERNQPLATVFPDLVTFAVVGTVVWAIVLFGVGYFWRNHSSFFTADREVDVQTDKYQTERYVPVMLPPWKILVAIAEEMEVLPEEVAKLKRFIKNSEKQK